MNEVLLTVNNLAVAFSEDGVSSIAVHDISFTINQGEIVAIAGESGSGKSVTALALMQLLPKQAHVSGQIHFTKKGQAPVNLLQLNEKSIQTFRGKDIAMIFQEPMTSLNPVLTCGYQVMEAIQLHQQVSRKIAKQKTIELFEKVKLPTPVEMIDRFPHQLSGGQKQRVMIAMAMSCNPSLLIADEPTTSLDVTVQKTILELIKDLQQQNGMSVLFISHDIGLLSDIADKVLLMYKGRIVEQGNTLDILKKPSHTYTKALLNCRPSLHSRGSRLPVVGDEIIENGKWKMENELKPVVSEQIIIDETKTVLSIEHLKVYFPGEKKFFGNNTEPIKAVDDVSFIINKGETVGLVGESGCGKTTLGKAILQLVRATKGKIILNGTELASLPKKLMQPMRKNLQIVFQDPYGSLNPRLTIGSAILEPMKVHDILTGKDTRKEKVIELLEKVNLKADHFNRYPHQFSGGQRQRICIARALALNPSFLIFDESVSALDLSVQAQVLNLLNDLKKEFGFTSLFISHDLSVVHYISDRILVMHKGKLVEDGFSDEIYFNPKNTYTRQLIDAIPGKRLSVI